MNSSRETRLQGPLGRYLRAPHDRAAHDRVRARVFADQESVRSGGRWSAVLRPRVAWALSVTLVVALALFWIATRAPDERLKQLDGRDFAGLVTMEQSERVALADGSSLLLGPETSLLPLSSSNHEFSLLLERGRLEVSVTPGGPRKWRIETKFGQVEVVGTVFVVERGPHSMRVAVRRGVVVVRSPRLAEGAARLTAGQAVVLGEPQAEPLREEPAHEGQAQAEPLRDTLPSANAGAAEPSPEAVPPLSSSRSASAGVVSRSQTASDDALDAELRQADSVRLQGNWRRAVELYAALHAKLARQSPGDSRLPLVRFAWASSLAGAGQAQLAAEQWERLLSAGAPSSLRQDAWLRLVEAQLALGRRDAARASAARYREEFPQGRHRLTLSGLLEPKSRAGAGD